MLYPQHTIIHPGDMKSTCDIFKMKFRSFQPKNLWWNVSLTLAKIHFRFVSHTDFSCIASQNIMFIFIIQHSAYILLPANWIKVTVKCMVCIMKFILYTPDLQKGRIFDVCIWNFKCVKALTEFSEHINTLLWLFSVFFSNIFYWNGIEFSHFSSKQINKEH